MADSVAITKKAIREGRVPAGYKASITSQEKLTRLKLQLRGVPEEQARRISSRASSGSVIISDSSGKQEAISASEFEKRVAAEKQAEAERIAAKIQAQEKKQTFLPQRLGSEPRKVSMADPRFQQQQATIKRAVKSERQRREAEKHITQKWNRFKTEVELGAEQKYERFQPPPSLAERLEARATRLEFLRTQRPVKKAAARTGAVALHAAAYAAPVVTGTRSAYRLIIKEPRVFQKRVHSGLIASMVKTPKYLKRQITQPMTFKQTGKALRASAVIGVREVKQYAISTKRRPIRATGRAIGFLGLSYAAGKVLSARSKPRFKVTTAKGVDYRSLTLKGKRITAGELIKPKTKIVTKAPKIIAVRGTYKRAVGLIGKKKVSILVSRGSARINIPVKSAPSRLRRTFLSYGKQVRVATLGKQKEFIEISKGKRLVFFGKGYKTPSGLIGIDKTAYGIKGLEKGKIYFSSGIYRATKPKKPSYLDRLIYKSFMKKYPIFTETTLISKQTTVLKAKRLPVFSQRLTGRSGLLLGGAAALAVGQRQSFKLATKQRTRQSTKPFSILSTKQYQRSLPKSIPMLAQRQAQATRYKQIPINILRPRRTQRNIPMFFPTPKFPKTIPSFMPRRISQSFKIKPMMPLPKSKRKYKYAPTFRAYTFSIFGKIPKGRLTGLEARPLQKIKL